MTSQRCRSTKCGVAAVLIVTIGGADAAVGAENGVRTILRHGPGGTYLEETRGPVTAGGAPSRPDGGASASPGAELLWHSNLATAVFTTADVAVDHGSVALGTELNPPQETRLAALDGDGTPDWAFPGLQVTAAASRHGDVVASTDFNGGTTTVTVRKWQADSGVPDWSFDIAPATPGTHRSVAVSPDGSTIAVLVTIQGAPNRARLYYFDAGSGVPQGFLDGDDGTFGRNIAMSDDGAYIAFMGGAFVYVADRDAGAFRFSVSAGATNDALALSGDGDRLAYGWTTLFYREWNGATYAPVWSVAGGGFSLGECAISSDGGTLVAGWLAFGFNQNRIDWFDLPGSTPRWTYTYPTAGGAEQEVVDDVAVTADGSYAAVASWGDGPGLIPEIHVFNRDVATPVHTVNTPGSMFDIDIAEAADGSIHVAACGKHVHANTQGNGGDAYSIRLPAIIIDCFADITGPGGAPDNVVNVDDLVEVILQWGTAGSADISGPGGESDGIVDVNDLVAVVLNWGPC